MMTNEQDTLEIANNLDQQLSLEEPTGADFDDSGGNWTTVKGGRSETGKKAKKKSTLSDAALSTSSEAATSFGTSLMNINANMKIGENYNREKIEYIRVLVEQPQAKVLVIMRGLSGSGKSTLASQITFNGVVISADTFFVNVNGVYKYDPFKINDAHHYCKNRANECMKKFISPVIIDNTNLKVWEFKPYISMAVKYNYHVEIVEPNTPWRYKPNILGLKNLHGVSTGKLKKCLDDFDQKINLDALIDECRRETSSSSTLNVSATQAKSKPTGLLGNFAEKVDWLLPEIDQDVSKPIQEVKSTPRRSDNILSVKPGISTVASAPQLSFTDDTTTTEIDHSVQMLQDMFPHVKSEVLVDLLLKYQNDINLVTDLILNSVILDDVVDEDRKISELKVVNQQTFQEVKSLVHLCTERLNRLESELIESVKMPEKISPTESPTNNNNNNNKKMGSKFHKNQSANDLIEQRTKFTKISSVRKNHSENEIKTIQRTMSCDGDNRQSADTSKDMDEEPLFNLKVDAHFLKSLIRIFGDESEENYLQDAENGTEIGIGMGLAFKLYASWKNSASNCQHSLKVDTNRLQIENDKKISLELFDEINMRNPIENVPVYLSDRGINSAEYSLRQIMAEEMAFNKKRERSNRIGNNQKSNDEFRLEPKSTLKNVNSNHSICSTVSSISNISSNSSSSSSGGSGSNGLFARNYAYQNNSSNPQSDERNYARLVKLDMLYTTYEKIIDKNAIETTFKNFNYDMDKTTNYLNEFYCVSNVNKPVSKFDFTKKPLNGLKDGATGSSETVDYYSNNLIMMYNNDDDENGRNSAKKFFNLRQEYFEKASEAYKRGWGAVAGYYAQMGHQLTARMDSSNQTASIKIFSAHNPDIRNSNTLDLHGLHVDEALAVLKNVLNGKKSEYLTENGRRKKTYIFVITGYGHHSETGPRLRPNIINYLKQKGFRYKEPHIGLLQVELFN